MQDHVRATRSAPTLVAQAITTYSAEAGAFNALSLLRVPGAPLWRAFRIRKDVTMSYPAQAPNGSQDKRGDTTGCVVMVAIQSEMVRCGLATMFGSLPSVQQVISSEC